MGDTLPVHIAEQIEQEFGRFNGKISRLWVELPRMQLEAVTRRLLYELHSEALDLREVVRAFIGSEQAVVLWEHWEDFSLRAHDLLKQHDLPIDESRLRRIRTTRFQGAELHAAEAALGILSLPIIQYLDALRVVVGMRRSAEVAEHDDPSASVAVGQPGRTGSLRTDWIDTTCAAARLGKSERTVRRWCEERKNPCHRAEFHAGAWRIPDEDVSAD